MRLLGTRSLVVGVAVASLVCPGARLGSGIGTWITEWAGAVRGGLIWGSGMHTGAVSRGRLVAGVWQDGKCTIGEILDTEHNTREGTAAGLTVVPYP